MTTSSAGGLRRVRAGEPPLADPANRVLLVEAGEDVVRGKSEPAGLRDAGARAFMLGRYFWPGLVNEVGEARVPYLAPRVMGGGSSINGCMLNAVCRATTTWRSRGVQGWGWNDLLPYFKRLENDLDFSGPLHAKRVLSPSAASLPPAVQADPCLARCAEKEGIPDLQDSIRRGVTAWRPLPSTMKGSRVSPRPLLI